MTATVLVTGGGGFVGSAVVRRLVRALQAGDPPRFADGARLDRVVALLRPDSGRDRLDELSSGSEWEIERADLTDPEELGSLVATLAPRAIVHAALPSGAGEDAVATLRVLVSGLAGLVGARLVHTGSAWVLPSGERLDESAPTVARSDYSRAKLSEDEALPGLAEAAGVEWINLRLFNVFGRHERPTRLVPHLVARLARGEEAELSHGGQTRDFTDVDAAAGAFARALEAGPEAVGRLYHVGSGRGTTARELAETVAEILGGSHLLRFGAAQTADDDLPCLVADPRRARQVLGWSAPPDLRASVESVVAWGLGRLEADGAERAAATGRAAG